MLTLAQKVAAVTAVAVLDMAVYAFGGVVFLLAAALATMPLTVAVVHR